MPEFLKYKDGSIIMVDASSDLIKTPILPLANIKQDEISRFRRSSQLLSATQHFGLWLVPRSDVGPLMAIEFRVTKDIDAPIVYRKQMYLFPLPEMGKTNLTKFVSEPWEIIAAARVLHIKLLSDSSKQPSL